MIESFAPITSAWGGALLDFLWQGVLIGLFAAFLLRAAKQSRPQIRYAIACMTLLLCFALPLFNAWHAMPNEFEYRQSMQGIQESPAAGTEIGAGIPNIALAESFSSQIPWIVIAWSLGCAFFSLRMASGLWWISSARRYSASNHHFSLQFSLEKMSARFGFTRQVDLRLCDEIDSPVTAGWWKPVIFLPGALISKMPPDYIEALLAHELAHIKRYDYLVNLIQSAIEAVLFFHPVVWWLSKQIRIERENIADDLAAEVLGEPRQLAMALAALDEFQFAGPLLAPAARGGNLMSRIQRLIKPTVPVLGWKMSAVLVALALACITVYAHDKSPGEHKSGAAVAAVSSVDAADKVEAGDAVQVNADEDVIEAGDAVEATEAIGADVAVEAGDAVEATEADDAVEAEDAVEANDEKITINNRDRHQTYALVEEGRDGMMLSGSIDDIKKIEKTKKNLKGDFLWFRRDGKAYVVQDPAVIAEVKAAWRDSEKLSDQMEALSAKMQVHSKVMEGLSAKMDAVSDRSNGRSEAMDKTSREMEVLGRQQEAIGKQMEAIGGKLGAAKSDEQRAAIDRDMQVQEEKMAALSRQMASLGNVMEQHSAKLENDMKPLEALSRQMEEASKPMQVLGREMEVLGKQQEALSKKADRKVLDIINGSLKNGQARPLGNLAP